MARTYRLGVGKFESVYTVSDLKKLGYISGKAVGVYIKNILTGGQGWDGRTVKMYKDCMIYVNENIPHVVVGEGKSARFYYKEKNVKTSVNTYLQQFN